MIEKVSGIVEIELTMNQVKFSSYNQPWSWHKSNTTRL